MTGLFTAEFAEEAARRGVEIKWIGGGTWELPDAIVPQRHLEAWKLSRENLLRSSPAALQQVSQESQVAELARLVEEVPVATYHSSKELPPSKHCASCCSHTTKCSTRLMKTTSAVPAIQPKGSGCVRCWFS